MKKKLPQIKKKLKAEHLCGWNIEQGTCVTVFFSHSIKVERVYFFSEACFPLERNNTQLKMTRSVTREDGILKYELYFFIP